MPVSCETNACLVVALHTAPPPAWTTNAWRRSLMLGLDKLCIAPKSRDAIIRDACKRPANCWEAPVQLWGQLRVSELPITTNIGQISDKFGDLLIGVDAEFRYRCAWAPEIFARHLGSNQQGTTGHNSV